MAYVLIKVKDDLDIEDTELAALSFSSYEDARRAMMDGIRKALEAEGVLVSCAEWLPDDLMPEASDGSNAPDIEAIWEAVCGKEDFQADYTFGFSRSEGWAPSDNGFGLIWKIQEI